MKVFHNWQYNKPTKSAHLVYNELIINQTLCETIIKSNLFDKNILTHVSIVIKCDFGGPLMGISTYNAYIVIALLYSKACTRGLLTMDF